MKKTNVAYTVETELTQRIKKFGEHLKEIILKNKVNYLMPLETKGALLVDVACGNGTLPKSLNIIYPRALRYISKSEISSSIFLLVDDIFFSGKHLKRIYDHVQSYGAQKDNIHCLAFLDFSSGDRDKEYDGKMHDQICKNYLQGCQLERKKALSFLQKEMLEKTMPSVYDHLTIEATDVSHEKYIELLRMFSLNHRLLHYGQRGAYLTSSILLDDLFSGSWDVPPKARLWWHPSENKLRITPVGFVSNSNNNYTNIPFCKDLNKSIVNTVVSGSIDDIEEAKYESKVLEARLHQLVLLKKNLNDLGLSFSFENDHLDRYYPKLNVTEIIQNILKQGMIVDLPKRDELFADTDYYSAINDVLRINREAWEKQPIDKPKDRVKKGYTASEIFSMLPGHSIIKLHAALDYCFDFHYLAVFRRKTEVGYSRCYRTTEISDGMLPEEIFGAAVIYSLKQPTPDWLINKIFPIIRSITPGLIYDGHLVITKAYFGDITRIKQSEESFTSWKDVQTDLWEIENSGAGVCYKKKNDPLIQSKVRKIMDDARLAGFRDTLSAVIFLLENGGRDAAILLDILTPGYGGADYVAYNLSRILALGSKLPTQETLNNIEWHSIGADEKIELLLNLFENEDNLLNKLMRRSSRLQQHYLLQVQAEKAVNKARPFESKVLYDALKKIKSGISGSVIAARNNYFHGFEEALNSIGIKQVERSKYMRNILSINARSIYQILYAISGQTFAWSYYSKYLLKQNDSFNFILGYDLTAERRQTISKGDERTRIDNELHKFIANWIVAFNGKLSTSGMNAGDLRFGFFETFEEAISAGCWLLHHIDQLHSTRGFPVGSEAIGIVITSGNYSIDHIGNASGQVLDMSGHWLKGKILERDKIDVATAKVGRKKFQFQESQAWIIEHNSFEVDRTNRNMIGAPKILDYQKGNIKLSAINIDKFIKVSPFPWTN
jgi:hypoxanthine phosphoribosyltransferase